MGSEYYLNTEKTDLIFGRFTSSIENKILIIINETSGKATFQINENIKAAITAEYNQIEHKGFDQFGNMKLLISNQFKYDDNKIWVENISKSPGKYGFYYKTTREIKVR